MRVEGCGGADVRGVAVRVEGPGVVVLWATGGRRGRRGRCSSSRRPRHSPAADARARATWPGRAG